MALKQKLMRPADRFFNSQEINEKVIIKTNVNNL